MNVTFGQSAGQDRPAQGTVLEVFRGVHPDGNTALVQRTADADYAQFDDTSHPKAYGWWKFSHNLFTKQEEKERP